MFQVFLKWADGLKAGLLSSEDMAYLKECIGSSEFMVLPTEQDKWVSLHPSTGIVCFCDDKRLRQQCKNMGKINFVYFEEISNDKTEVLQTKLSHLLKALGVPLLSEVRPLNDNIPVNCGKDLNKNSTDILLKAKIVFR